MTNDNTDGRREFSRRSIARAAGWSVPVIAFSAAIPAYAASEPAGLALSLGPNGLWDPSETSRAGNTMTVGTTTTATVIVTDDSGMQLAGQTVVLSISGESTFSNGGTSISVVTDSNGTATVPLTAGFPVTTSSRVTVVAQSASLSQTAGLTLSPGPVMTYTYDQLELNWSPTLHSTRFAVFAANPGAQFKLPTPPAGFSWCAVRRSDNGFDTLEPNVWNWVDIETHFFGISLRTPDNAMVALDPSTIGAISFRAITGPVTASTNWYTTYPNDFSGSIVQLHLP